MAKTRMIALGEIVLDYSIYPRKEVSDLNVRHLLRALDAGQKLPAILVCVDTKRVVDGFHRVTAYRKRLQPDDTIAVEYRAYGSDADLYLDGVRLNARHGRPLTEYERRCVVVKAEELGISYERVADSLAVPPSYIDEARLSTPLRTRPCLAPPNPY